MKPSFSRSSTARVEALVGLGVALGLAGAFALTRFLSGLLFQVAPHDPAAMAVTVAVIVAVALVAAAVPARRASHVDPLESLR